MREREPRERVRVGSHLLGGVEAVEVEVQGGQAIERVHAVVGGRGHHDRVPDPAPSVAHADADGRVRRHGRAHDRVGEDVVTVELVGGGHLEVVAGAAADERHLGAEHGVGAAHDLLLVAGEAVGEQHERAVRARLDAFEGAGDVRPGLAQPPAAAVGGCRGHREACAAERDHDEAGVGCAAGGDLSGRRAADEGGVGRLCPDRREQRREVVGVGGEQQDQRRPAALGGCCRRLGAGHRRVGLGRMPDAGPARLVWMS